MKRKRKPKIHIKEDLNRILDEDTDEPGVYVPRKKCVKEETDFLDILGGEVFFEEEKVKPKGILGRWRQKK